DGGRRPRGVRGGPAGRGRRKPRRGVDSRTRVDDPAGSRHRTTGVVRDDPDAGRPRPVEGDAGARRQSRRERHRGLRTDRGPAVVFDAMYGLIQQSADRIYPLGFPLDYEPTPDQTVAAIAERRGENPLATMYDLMLESDAGAMLMLPFYNYAEGNHDAIYEMLTHPA